ncbi:MAG TPA: hypothetical protein VF600_10490 [Abditibacteriaceae bacterium]|jgi:hypothetical protein
MSTHGRELTDDERWAILRRYGLEVDPVIEAYEKDVDRTLLRENLRRSVAERSANFLAMARFSAEAQRLRQKRLRQATKSEQPVPSNSRL